MRHTLLNTIVAVVIAMLVAACGAPTESVIVPPAQVLFVCEHGNVKSLMAASFFNQIAEERGLRDRAISRGTAPDSPTVPAAIIAGLRHDGFDVASFHPVAVEAADVSASRRVVLINTALPAHVPLGGIDVEQWNEIPPASVDYAAASAALKQHVARLINDLAQPLPPAGGVGGERPNVVVVLVDDLRFDEFHAGGHPYLETPNMDRLAAEGALFVNSFHAVPLCSPNRATLLTGQFPSRHGILDNVARNLASHHLETFNLPMQAAGYRTAFLGKWHMGNDPTPRPGWDYWVAMPGQGHTTDPELFEDGVLHKVPGYTSDLLTDRAVSFIRREHGLPFLLYLAHKAVHPDVVQRDDGSLDAESDRGYVPAVRHQGRYSGRVFARRQQPSEIAADLAGKPAIRHALAKLPTAAGSSPGEHQHAAVPWTGEETIRRRAEMILAVDESLGRIMTTLESLELLDKTVVVLSSDNGFFFGEHGLTTERRLPYEESIRNPLLMRYPPRIPAGSRPKGLVLTVDLAPTVLDLAGVPIGPSIQGRSLVPLFQATPAGWRQAVLVEFYSNDQPFPHLMDMDYRAIRTGQYKYIHWIKHPDDDELYDLQADPLERRNLASDPALAPVKASLRADLGKLVLEAVGLPAR